MVPMAISKPCGVLNCLVHAAMLIFLWWAGCTLGQLYWPLVFGPAADKNMDAQSTQVAYP